MTPSTELELNDICAKWLSLFTPANALTDAEIVARLNLYMEALSDVPPDILNESWKLAVRDAPDFQPKPGAVFAHAGPMMKDRIADLRYERERREIAERKALPALAAVAYAKPEDTASILAETFAKLAAGHAKLTGGTMPGAPAARPVSAGPARSPTADDYAALRSAIRPAHGGASDALKAMVNGA